MSKPETQTRVKDESQPLPCRGCQKDCVNLTLCDGKLWRMKDSAINSPEFKGILK